MCGTLSFLSFCFFLSLNSRTRQLRICQSKECELYWLSQWRIYFYHIAIQRGETISQTIRFSCNDERSTQILIPSSILFKGKVQERERFCKKFRLQKCENISNHGVRFYFASAHQNGAYFHFGFRIAKLMSE